MQTRRETLHRSAVVTGLLAATGLFPQFALAYNKSAFDAKTMRDALKALGDGALVESKDVVIEGPDIAENGAVVPVGASTTLTGVRPILMLVAPPPSPLAALFNVTDSIEPNFKTRVKMGQTSDVYVVAVMADGRALFAKKEIKVTLGGCGG